MSAYKVVVVGFSAGGVEALTRLVADLPADFPAAVFVAHHFPAESVSALPPLDIESQTHDTAGAGQQLQPTAGRN